MRKVYGGIDLGGTSIKAGLLSANGERIAFYKIPTGARSGHEEVSENLLETGRKLIEAAKKKGARLHGIGIGSPGTIRYPEGIVTDSSPNIPGWVGVNFTEMFADLPVDIRADNDANCMALGEHKFGAGRGTDSGFYVTIGTGIGGALVFDKRLWRGASFAAGEFGHTVLKYNGIKCKCGRHGCVEAYTAVPAFLRSARNLVRNSRRSSLKNKLDNLTPELVFDAYHRGDAAAAEAISRNADMLGSAIGSVVNLLNPDIVVIGGGLAQAGRGYIDLIRNKILDYAFNSATDKIKIKAALLGNNAGWIGAACLHLE
jgi:glucokinase